MCLSEFVLVLTPASPHARFSGSFNYTSIPMKAYISTGTIEKVVWIQV
jgi:hypothetical protein